MEGLLSTRPTPSSFPPDSTAHFLRCLQASINSVFAAIKHTNGKMFHFGNSHGLFVRFTFILTTETVNKYCPNPCNLHMNIL